MIFTAASSRLRIWATQEPLWNRCNDWWNSIFQISSCRRKLGSHCKATGPDNVILALLLQSLEVIIGPLTGLLRGCLAVGYAPKHWLKGKVIFISIHGRRSYSNVKDFRPISLILFLLKTLKWVVDQTIYGNCTPSSNWLQWESDGT